MSLHSALRHLRDTHTPRFVWADAICINQDDIEERNQQVKQMDWVYRQANHTVIYLGDGTPETSRFLETLHSKSPVDWKPPSLGSGSVEHARDLMDPEVEALAREWILARPWFKRVWILQELVFSQDPWIQCGTSVARWSSFDTHISEIATKRPLKPEEKIAQTMGKLHLEHRNPPSHIDIWEDDDGTTFAERLYDLIKSRKGFGVTDPRDILFAHLRLVRPPHPAESENGDFNSIMVDYQKNETEVYRDLAHYLIKNFEDFRTFGLLDSNEKRSESQAPSWAPDWVSRPPSRFSRLSDVLGYNQVFSRRTNLIWASQSRVLVCGGSYLGEVQELGPIIEKSLCPQIAEDFSQFVHGTLDLSLWEFIKSAFEETYQKWRNLVRTVMPDPERVLKEFEERHIKDEVVSKTLEEKLRATNWPHDSEMDLREYLIAKDIRSIVSDLSRVLHTAHRSGQFREVCEEPWSWNGGFQLQDGTLQVQIQLEIERLQSLLAQLVFSSFVTDGPNLFYSRRFAKIGEDFFALVPGVTQIGDIVSLPTKDEIPIPLVLRDVSGDIDRSLDEEIRQRIHEALREDLSRAARENLDHLKECEVVEHLTIVGECFVEGWMHRSRRAGNTWGEGEPPFQLLALH
jgi:hypothetical protein